jgi:peptidoglycan biosynthesis protein MviN/MurJ (putative lipid II flippase)
VCYALDEYRVPFFIALFLAAVDVGLSLWLKETVLRAGGIALANSISFTVGSILLGAFVRGKLRGFEGRRIMVTLSKVAISSLPAAAFVIVFNMLAGDWWERGRSVVGFLIVFALAAVFSSAVIGGYFVTRVEMLKDLTARFRGRS